MKKKIIIGLAIAFTQALFLTSCGDAVKPENNTPSDTASEDKNSSGGVDPGVDPSGGVDPGTNPSGGVDPGTNPNPDTNSDVTVAEYLAKLKKASNLDITLPEKITSVSDSTTTSGIEVFYSGQLLSSEFYTEAEYLDLLSYLNESITTQGYNSYSKTNDSTSSSGTFITYTWISKENNHTKIELSYSESNGYVSIALTYVTYDEAKLPKWPTSIDECAGTTLPKYMGLYSEVQESVVDGSADVYFYNCESKDVEAYRKALLDAGFHTFKATEKETNPRYLKLINPETKTYASVRISYSYSTMRVFAKQEVNENADWPTKELHDVIPESFHSMIPELSNEDGKYSYYYISMANNKKSIYVTPMNSTLEETYNAYKALLEEYNYNITDNGTLLTAKYEFENHNSLTITIKKESIDVIIVIQWNIYLGTGFNLPENIALDVRHYSADYRFVKIGNDYFYGDLDEGKYVGTYLIYNQEDKNWTYYYTYISSGNPKVDSDATIVISYKDVDNYIKEWLMSLDLSDYDKIDSVNEKKLSRDTIFYSDEAEGNDIYYTLYLDREYLIPLESYVNEGSTHDIDYCVLDMRNSITSFAEENIDVDVLTKE